MGGAGLGFVIILEVTLKVLTDRLKAGNEGKDKARVTSGLMVSATGWTAMPYIEIHNTWG